MESYDTTAPAGAAPVPGSELYVLSARTDEQLRSGARRLAAHLRGPGQHTPLADVAHTLCVGRDPLDVRAAFVAPDRDVLLDVLGRIADGTEGTLTGVYTGRLVRGGPLAGIFDGLAGGRDLLASLASRGELSTLARLWVQGADLDWATLVADRDARRTALPAYPFERVPYWLPSSALRIDGDGAAGLPSPAVPSTHDEDADSALVWTPHWAPAPVSALVDGPAPATVVVLDRPDTPALPAEPGVRPWPVLRAVEYTPDAVPADPSGHVVRSGNVDDLRTVLERAVVQGPLVLVDRRGLAPYPEHTGTVAGRLPADLGRAISVGALPALTCVQITSAASEDPADAAAAAFGRAVARETSRYRHVRVTLADGATPTLGDLVDEARSADTEIRVGRDGRRVLRFAEAAERAGASGTGFVEGGHYVVTGGSGGVGRLVSLHLAEQYGARVTLLGRSAPGPEHERFCAQLAALGGEGLYVRADVTDRGALDTALRTARSRFGAVGGVLHAAGLIEDALLQDKPDESVARVLAPKTTGTVLLDELTAEDRPDLFILFSSVVGTVGNAGQSDYAAVNAYLDAFAVRRAQLAEQGLRGGRTVSVAWPLWAEGGMRLDPEAAEMAVATIGLVPVSTVEAMRVLEDAVRGDAPRLYVSCAGPERTANALASAGLAARAGAAPARTRGPGLDRAAVRDLVLSRIAETGRVAAERLDPAAELGAYGFNSVLLTALANRLNETFGLALTPVVFYEFPTADALTGHLVERHATAVRSAMGVAAAQSPAAPELSAAVEPSAVSRSESVDPVVAAQALAGPGDGDAIAIVGLAGRFPGAADAEEFWHNLLQGRDLVTEVPAERWYWRDHAGDPRRDKGATDCRRGGFLDSVTAFDTTHFRLSPREASLMDPQQRLFPETCWHTLEDVGYDPRSFAGSRTGVFAGATLHDYLEVLREHDTEVAGHTVTGNVHAIVANRVSYLLDLRGPSETVDTACSSSLVALHRALAAIRSGECEAALVGGVNVVMTPTWYVSLSRGGMLSKAGRCHTFDSRADGYVRAEGVGALLLKPLSKALADGDTVRAVIRGSAVGHGGRAHSLTAPTPRGQADTIVAALRDAGVDPAGVGYVESHGTGTRLGDPIEIQGLKHAFERAADGPLPEAGTVLGALKASVGHLESAAGVAGIISAVHALRDRALPPVTGLGDLNPYLELEGSPFRVLRSPEAWEAKDGVPRRAGVSSFGFGGVNAHVVLEEPPASAWPDGAADGPQVVVLSARTRCLLHEHVGRLREFADSSPVRLADLAWTSQTGRTPLAQRLAVIATTPAELAERLAEFLSDTGEAGVPCVHLGGPHTGPSGAAVRPADPADAAARWAAGEDVNWAVLHSGPRRRIPFPLHPFDHSQEFGPSGVPARTVRPQQTASVPETAPAPPEPTATGGAVPALLTRDWTEAPLPGADDGARGPLGVLLVPGDETLDYAEAAAHAAGAAKSGWVVVRERSLLPHLGTDEYDLDPTGHPAGHALAEQLPSVDPSKGR
ncbi:SDR family NAD(P)-dependent oxidoreductase [Streptomyces sp. NPDC047515]|uniref:SDR family NAD(P)-dependent oxidoreductase n=1 Tax=Streptomyces sp. NPDC047515 TaxID=3155380 RepID=UPI0033EBC7BB